MKKVNKTKVFEVYNKIIDWFNSHRDKDGSDGKLLLNYIQQHISPRASILDVVAVVPAITCI